MNVTLFLQVDYDPTETSWSLKDDVTGAIVDSVSVGYYRDTERCTKHERNIEILYGRVYTFTIQDSFGDGMSKVCPGNYSMAITETGEVLFAEDGFSFTS